VVGRCPTGRCPTGSLPLDLAAGEDGLFSEKVTVLPPAGRRADFGEAPSLRAEPPEPLREGEAPRGAGGLELALICSDLLKSPWKEAACCSDGFSDAGFKDASVLLLSCLVSAPPRVRAFLMVLGTATMARYASA